MDSLAEAIENVAQDAAAMSHVDEPRDGVAERSENHSRETSAVSGSSRAAAPVVALGLTSAVGVPREITGKRAYLGVPALWEQREEPDTEKDFASRPSSKGRSDSRSTKSSH